MLLFLTGMVVCSPAQPVEISSFGLIGWWSAEGHVRDIVGGHDGQMISQTSFDDGVSGKSFSLDGCRSWVNIPHSPVFDFGLGDFSAQIWVYFRSTNSEQVLLEKYIEHGTRTNQPGWTFTKISNNSLFFGGGNAWSWQCLSVPVTIPLKTWTQFVIRRAQLTNSIFMNGVMVTNAYFPWNVDCESSFKIGHRGNSSDTPGAIDQSIYLDGRADEVMVFNRALFDAEIAALYKAGTNGLWVNALAMTNSACAGLRVYGPLGSNYLVEATSSLAGNTSWITLTNATIREQPEVVPDPWASNQQSRFYRTKIFQ
jgi:hypothetical protein